jgi:hypothetical protein
MNVRARQKSMKSLEINPETKNHHIPEPREEVNRAQNQEEITIQLPENSPGATLNKNPVTAQEEHQQMHKMIPDAAAWEKTEPTFTLSKVEPMEGTSSFGKCKIEVRDPPRALEYTGGACSKTANPGESLHCFNHCPVLKKAGPEEKL